MAEDSFARHGLPTTQGKIPFNPPGTSLQCETAYWLWGNTATSTAPPLIILHGGPGAPGRDWVCMAALHRQYAVPVLLYDQIGCGASTHLRETRGDINFWKTDLFIAELENLKSGLGVGTFDLLGHSDGCITAITYALMQPSGLRKLILASGSASDSLRRESRVKLRALLPQETQDTIKKCEDEGRLNAPEYFEAESEYMRRHLCRLDPMPPEMGEVVALLMEDDTVIHSLYGSVMEPKGERKFYDVVARLPEIDSTTVPGGVLLTRGRYDMSLAEGMMPFFTQIRARVRWIEFAESAHVPHLEEPETYLHALAEFLTLM